VLNVTKGEKERIGNILYINGKKLTDCHEAKAGDIVALPKLKNTFLNDTLCAPASKIVFQTIEFPRPVSVYAVEPRAKGDEDKIGTALHRAAEEDPSIHVERNRETHETVLWGMGDMHLGVTLEHIKHRSKVDIIHHTPKVAYRETITGSGEGHYKHKKQSGGRGQYGECYVRVFPRAEGDEEWFSNKLVGGSIPGNFVPACQKGFLEGMAKGPLTGSEVSNVKVELYDGSYHDVDSSEMAFKIAANLAYKELVNANPVLLEPVGELKVYVPGDLVGDVIGDLNKRRGRVLGMSAWEGGKKGYQVVEAEVPLGEMSDYTIALRALSQGKGRFTFNIVRYEEVPALNAQKIIADAKAEAEAEK